MRSARAVSVTIIQAQGSRKLERKEAVKKSNAKRAPQAKAQFDPLTFKATGSQSAGAFSSGAAYMTHGVE
eukprot:19550-Heterococcus_DN1.PRE.1